jgi:hypothetical protein
MRLWVAARITGKEHVAVLRMTSPSSVIKRCPVR